MTLLPVHRLLSRPPAWTLAAAFAFQQSLVPAPVTPAGCCCCCGDVWWPSGSPQRGWRAPWPPCARSCGSSAPPPAGRSTGAAWKTRAPPETHGGLHFKLWRKSHLDEATGDERGEEKLLKAHKDELIFSFIQWRLDSWNQKVFAVKWEVILEGRLHQPTPPPQWSEGRGFRLSASLAWCLFFAGLLGVTGRVSQCLPGCRCSGLDCYLDGEGPPELLRVQTLIPKAQQDLEAWWLSTVEPVALNLWSGGRTNLTRNAADELTQEKFVKNGVTFGVTRMESLSHAGYANVICHFTKIVPEEHVGGGEVAKVSQKSKKLFLLNV